MTHNALSKSISEIPMWIVQAVVGVALSAGVAWTTWASVSTWRHDTRISVVETRVDDMTKKLDEIQDSQKEINHKLDRIIERESRRNTPEPSLESGMPTENYHH